MTVAKAIPSSIDMIRRIVSTFVPFKFSLWRCSWIAHRYVIGTWLSLLSQWRVLRSWSLVSVSVVRLLLQVVCMLLMEEGVCGRQLRWLHLMLLMSLCLMQSIFKWVFTSFQWNSCCCGHWSHVLLASVDSIVWLISLDNFLEVWVFSPPAWIDLRIEWRASMFGRTFLQFKPIFSFRSNILSTLSPCWWCFWSCSICRWFCGLLWSQNNCETLL